jgi:DNA-binding CsgD family transcriptional regulator
VVAGDRSTRRAVDRIERLCAGFDEERPLRTALVEELRRSVTFDSFVWALTDPVTEVAISPLAVVPDAVLRELPRLIRVRYLTTVNRWSLLDHAVDSIHRATDGHPERSLLHREVLAGFDVGDVATVCLRDAHGLWGWLDLWRPAGEAPFTAAELDVLGVLEPVITAALRRCQARTFERPGAVPDRPGPIVLVLSADLDVKAQTPDTEEYLRALLPPDGDRRPVPAGAYNVAAQLLAVEEGIDDHPPSSRVRLRDGVWLTFRAARVQDDVRSPESDIAVSIEVASPNERLDLYSRAHALSPRERELLALVVNGADTRTVAERLFLSEHTVQDHLKAIFAKTGTRNRRTLVNRVTGA